MTAVIWCCVLNLSWAESCRVYAFSRISLVTFFFIQRLQTFFYSCHVFTFLKVFILYWTFLHLWLKPKTTDRMGDFEWQCIPTGQGILRAVFDYRSRIRPSGPIADNRIAVDCFLNRSRIHVTQSPAHVNVISFIHTCATNNRLRDFN